MSVTVIPGVELGYSGERRRGSQTHAYFTATGYH